MTTAPTILWFRQDLRLTDNPALAAAVARGKPMVALYVLDDETPGRWALGGASRWWLHGSLESLGRSLAKRGASLALRQVVAESGADAVFWNRCYEPFAIARDKALKGDLAAQGLDVRSFNSASLAEPWTLETKAGGPFKVFTPFWRNLRSSVSVDRPVPASASLEGFPLEGDSLNDWRLRPSSPDWAGGLRDSWQPGEQAARDRLADFLDGPIEGYQDARDRPARPGTSRLSPYLHWGEISPRQIWHAVAARGPDTSSSAEGYLRELGWREFSRHLLFHWPDLPEKPWKESFAAFPWREDEAAFDAWCHGRTGFPIVDAGMRELGTTGWMHNRVRMITASFLVKDLLIPWQRGEAWFWDTLVDADLANNAASWQWVAGSGADASPFFRIFNPVLQGAKFDAEGAYVRRWVPEIAALPDKFIHCPWDAPQDALSAAGLVLGEAYPQPIVDHAAARRAALNALETIKL